MATEWASRISGPIPSHAAYSANDCMVHESGGHRTPMFGLQGRSIGFREKPGSKDYMRENVRRMREIQRASRTRDEEKQKPIKPTWRSSRYDNVESKVVRHIYDFPDSVPRRPASADFLRAHEKTGPPLQSRVLFSARRGSSSDRPVDKNELKLEVTGRPVSGQRHERYTNTNGPARLRASSARESSASDSRRDIDYIRTNARAARSPPLRRPPSVEQLEELKRRKEMEERAYQRGRIPDYLLRRRQEELEAEEEYYANLPEPDQPPGHRKMPESERLAAMNLLRNSEKELLGELSKMPIRTDTLRVRKRKEEIENKLAEIDEAVKIFSKSKVYVKID